MKKLILISVFWVICLNILTGCDPIYPIGNLTVEKIETLSRGQTVDISIIYPNTGGSIVTGWKEQTIEIINGDDIISASGLSVTGLKSGTALIKISATTIISDARYEEKVYSIEKEVKVK